MSCTALANAFAGKPASAEVLARGTRRLGLAL